MKDQGGQIRYMGKMFLAHRGFTLFELLIAMFMMVLVSVMLYSILNVGISFSSKGEKRIIEGERQRAFLELLHRQVHGTWADPAERKLRISAEDNSLRLVTTSPLLNRDAYIVMAFYLYDSRDDTLYYMEKLDYYNPEYFEDYEPVSEEMFVLLERVADFSIDYDREEGLVKLVYGGYDYNFVPRCWVEEERED